MAIHAPVIQHRHVATVPNLAPLALAIILFAILVAAVMLIRPTATPAEPGTWMTEQRQGEIQAGLSGPGSDVLTYRAGEINAANE